MTRSSYLMGLVCAASITTAGIQACDVAAAFAIPAVLTNYCMSKRTVEDARAQAQAKIYYYENHLGVYTIEEIRKAYWVMRATDKQIENNLWWENKLIAGLVGICTATIYDAFKEPYTFSCSSPKIHFYWNLTPRSSYVMPYYRG